MVSGPTYDEHAKGAEIHVACVGVGVESMN
jgi:hypothetical protein